MAPRPVQLKNRVFSLCTAPSSEAMRYSKRQQTKTNAMFSPYMSGYSVYTLMISASNKKKIALSDFHDFTSMIFDPALVTAKPPPPSPFSTLLHDLSTAWADIYWHIIMPLGVIVFVPACITAKFLPRNMTRWFKRLPAVQALQYSLFFTHDLSAP